MIIILILLILINEKESIKEYSIDSNNSKVAGGNNNIEYNIKILSIDSNNIYLETMITNNNEKRLSNIIITSQLPEILFNNYISSTNSKNINISKFNNKLMSNINNVESNSSKTYRYYINTTPALLNNAIFINTIEYDYQNNHILETFETTLPQIIQSEYYINKYDKNKIIPLLATLTICLLLSILNKQEYKLIKI